MAWTRDGHMPHLCKTMRKSRVSLVSYTILSLQLTTTRGRHRRKNDGSVGRMHGHANIQMLKLQSLHVC